MDERKGGKGWIVGGDFNLRTVKEKALEDEKEVIE